MTNPFLPDPGLYRRFKSAAPQQPAVFLDRDGVIVEEVGYLHRAEDIRFVPGSLGAIRALNECGIPVIVITNQAGIGRGYYQWPDFESVQTEIERQLELTGGWLDGIWACGYHPEHSFRKPNPGMLLDAAQQMGVDLARSWLAGDKIIDIEAAKRAGLAGAVLVRTGYGSSHEKQLPQAHWDTRFQTEVADSLWAAVEMLKDRCRL